MLQKLFKALRQISRVDEKLETIFYSYVYKASNFYICVKYRI